MLPRLRGRCSERTGVIGDVRGRGAMLAVELVRPGHHRAGRRAAPARIAKACHAQGVVVLTAGTYGNVLRFLPPLVIGQDLLDRGARRPRRPSFAEPRSAGAAERPRPSEPPSRMPHGEP